MADLARVREGLRLHAREGDLFVADLEALDADQWDLPTNCPPWLVRTLAAHVARQVESYIGNIEPGLRGESVEPESREKRTNRMNEIAAWETPAIISMLRETNTHFNTWFGSLTPEQLDIVGPHSHGPRTAAWFIDMRLSEMAFHRMDLEGSLGWETDLDPETARHLLPMLLELNVPAVVNRDKTGGEGTYVIAVKGEPVGRLAVGVHTRRVDGDSRRSDGDTRFEGDAAALAQLVYGRSTWPELEKAGRLDRHRQPGRRRPLPLPVQGTVEGATLGSPVGARLASLTVLTCLASDSQSSSGGYPHQARGVAYAPRSTSASGSASSSSSSGTTVSSGGRRRAGSS